MAELLIIHHRPTSLCEKICEVMFSSLDIPELEDLVVHQHSALEPDLDAFARADAYIFFTPANIGYISGALKHYFDTVYYPSLEIPKKRYYSAVIHGNNDTSGASRACTRICQGMGLELAFPLVECIGPWEDTLAPHIEELCTTVAAYALGL